MRGAKPAKTDVDERSDLFVKINRLRQQRYGCTINGCDVPNRICRQLFPQMVVYMFRPQYSP
jgi:hypothetical protein